MNIKLPKISRKILKINNKPDSVILQYDDYEKIITTMDKLKENIKKLKQKSSAQKQKKH